MTRHRSPAKSSSTPAFPRGLLVLGLIVGLGLTFVIGMRYGNARGTHLGQNAVQEKKLSRLDRQEQELRQRRAQERARLSFHSTLAGPAREVKRPKNKVKAQELIAKTEPKSAQPVQEKALEQQAQSATTNAVQTEPDQAVANNLAEAAQEPRSTALAQLSEQAKSILDDEVKAPAEQNNTVMNADADAQNQDKQDEDKQGEDNVVAQNAELGGDSEASHFSLQVGAFPDAGSAQSLVERLSEKGYAVRIVSAEVAGKGTWYRVRVGDFTAREKAEQKCSQLSNNEGLFALVVPERG